MDPDLKFTSEGLIPAILQDSQNGQVLMMAWMNAEALRLTRETGQVHFWSRSRQSIWHKGGTSGNRMHVRGLSADCDGDTLLVQVQPEGPACHTGRPSCFYQEIIPPEAEGGNIFQELFRVIERRRENSPPGSYTAGLFSQGQDKISKKLLEEALEVILAARAESDRRLAEEAADLVYHLFVMLAGRGVELEDLEGELRRRRREKRDGDQSD